MRVFGIAAVGVICAGWFVAVVVAGRAKAVGRGSAPGVSPPLPSLPLSEPPIRITEHERQTLELNASYAGLTYEAEERAYILFKRQCSRSQRMELECPNTGDLICPLYDRHGHACGSVYIYQYGAAWTMTCVIARRHKDTRSGHYPVGDIALSILLAVRASTDRHEAHTRLLYGHAEAERRGYV